MLALGAPALKEKTGQELVQFLSDPQALNSYAYARNNPLRLVDPEGEWFKEVITGKQSWSNFVLEVGGAAEQLSNDSKVWQTVMDHPYATGAVVGITAGLAALGGAVAATALSEAYLGGAGTACLVWCEPTVRKGMDYMTKYGTSPQFDPVAQQRAWLDGVNNTRVTNLIKDVFRAQDRIPGGTIEAIKREVATGQLTSGKSHIQKGIELVNRINYIERSQTLNPTEIARINIIRDSIQVLLKNNK